MHQSKTFHKGDGLFGETAGVQCACNSLFALCWSRILENSIWQSLDLDHILVEGDKLYNTLNTTDLLNMDDLRHSVRLWESELPIIC